MLRGEQEVRTLVSAVARTIESRLSLVTDDIHIHIEESIPALRRLDFAAVQRASVAANVAAAIRILSGTDGDAFSSAAPAAATDFARRLAQQGVPASELVRAYRVGQARFIRHCIRELLAQLPGDHIEGHAALDMVELVSDYVDQVVEKVLAAYAQARDGWVRDRSAVLALRVREILRGKPRDLAAVERALDYRLDRYHLGLVVWTETAGDSDALVGVRRLVGAVSDHVGAGPPLLIPSDETVVWAWIPTDTSLAHSGQLATALKTAPDLSVAVGEPGSGQGGFRRTHQQAVSACLVALAAGDQHVALTPFAEVAPIAMLCADLESARAWVGETLGDLALDSDRNEGLRETARVFLETGGSYTATAERLFLHRNTAQYRVRKAELVRGRPFRDGRLDVELALLACRWMRGAVLSPSTP